ncbi:MAG TPA: caspase family protein [Anaerolineaceae bacterium]|nr:caspase family protein [Anaerolineaceae bacterium]
MEGRKLALVIGNSEYGDAQLSRLVTPDSDVNGLAEVLRSSEVGSFDEVTALVNQPGAVVRRAISEFFAGRGRDDLLVLYFSGHGICDDRGQLFLAVKDTEPNLLRGTAIPAGFITEEMDNSRSKRQVLILDCCHSGAFSRGMKGAPGSSVGTAAAFQGTGFGRVVLTATDSTQYAWEGDQVIGQAENSVFTRHLIEGLSSGKADLDSDGQITLDELYDYVYEQVISATPRQTPSKWSYGQQGDIVIAHNPHPVVRAAALPPDLQQTIEDPRPWVREGAVRELARLLQTSSPGLALAAREALARLAEDDSRRVASSAAESLGEAPMTGEAAPAGQQAVPSTAEAPEAEQPKAEILPETASEAAAAPGVEPETALPAAVNAYPAGAVQKTGRQLLDGTIAFLAKAFQGSRQKKILMIAAGWALGGLVAGLIAWNTQSITVGFLVGGAISGMAIGLALSQEKRSFGIILILLISGFAITWVLDGVFSDALSASFAESFPGINYTLLGWDATVELGKALGRLLGSFLAGGVGGLASALALRQEDPALPIKALTKLVISLALIWAVPVAGFTLIANLTGMASSPSILVVLIFVMALVGWLMGRVVISR